MFINDQLSNISIIKRIFLQVTSVSLCETIILKLSFKYFYFQEFYLCFSTYGFLNDSMLKYSGF